MGIPAGLSYQRVVRKGTPESGFALHGLNAVYLPSRKKWLRLDPRGNKPGWGEIDYPWVFVRPDASVIAAMRSAKDTRELFEGRPSELVVFN
jgi:transglutaminase-like putative cysteine protease